MLTLTFTSMLKWILCLNSELAHFRTRSKQQCILQDEEVSLTLDRIRTSEKQSGWRNIKSTAGIIWFWRISPVEGKSIRDVQAQPSQLLIMLI